MPLCEGAAGASFQGTLKCFREQFIWQRDIGHQVPRFEFVCVNRFARIVLREARAQIVSGTDVRLLGVDYASQGYTRRTSTFAPFKLRGTGCSPPSLAGLELANRSTGLGSKLNFRPWRGATAGIRHRAKRLAQVPQFEK